MGDEISQTMLPVLSNSVDEDDVVGLADGDFGGVRWERHVIHNIALFSKLAKVYTGLIINTQPAY